MGIEFPLPDFLPLDLVKNTGRSALLGSALVL